MSEVQIIGGPRDGAWIAVEDPRRPIRFPQPVVLTSMDALVDTSWIPLDIIEITPELTRDGWVARWPT